MKEINLHHPKLFPKTTYGTSSNKVSVDNFLLVEGQCPIQYFRSQMLFLKPGGLNLIKIAGRKYSRQKSNLLLLKTTG